MAGHFVMHAYHQPLTLQLGDKWYQLEPNEPYEIVDGPFYAAKLLEIYGHIYGIIEVRTEKSRTGVHIDIDAEEKRAKDYLVACEKTHIANYVQEQRGRIAVNNQPVPPSGLVNDIIEKHGIDLKAKYGINLMGVDQFEDKEKIALKEENARLREQVTHHDTTMAALMERMERLEQNR